MTDFKQNENVLMHVIKLLTIEFL